LRSAEFLTLDSLDAAVQPCVIIPPPQPWLYATSYRLNLACSAYSSPKSLTMAEGPLYMGFDLSTQQLKGARSCLKLSSVEPSPD